MALVTRRVLQRLLDENARFLTLTQQEGHVRALNGKHVGKDVTAALSTEYEIVLLNALSKLGRFEYETARSGTRRPDIYFEPTKAPDQAFVADITAVSDAGADLENPIRDFRKEVGALLKAHRLTGAGFAWRVEGSKTGPARRQKMKLSLPRKSELREVLRSQLTPFLRSIKAAPSRAASISLSGYDVHITYDPKRRDSVGSHPSFTAPYSLDNNPILNALRKKPAQLKQSGFEGVMGIFLCDGGCDALHSLTSIGQTMHFNARQIVSRFLELNHSVSFVYALTIPQPYPRPEPPRYSFHGQAFFNPEARHPCTPAQKAALEALSAKLPTPRRTPINALHLLRSPEALKGSFYGGVQIRSGEIWLSARAAAQLLAGRIDIETFLRDHRLSPSQARSIPFFESQLKRNRMIVAARVERSPDEDDDWLVLTFGDPDSAIAQFRVTHIDPTSVREE